MLYSGTFLLAVYIVVAGVYGQQKGLGFNAMIKLAGKEFLALLLNIGPVDEPEQRTARVTAIERAADRVPSNLGI